MPTATVPITFRAMLQRLNRRLAHTEERLWKARGQSTTELGDWYVVHLRLHSVEQCHVDPVALGQELGVLRAWESVKDEQ